MDEVFVECEKLDHFGRGLCHVSGKIMFVPNLLPLEKAFVRVISDKRKYMIGEVVRLVKKSDDRIEPKCGLVNCGCAIKAMNYDKTLEFKKNKVTEILKKYSGLDGVIKEIIPSENVYFYRNKITLKVKDGKIGYFKNGSNELIEVKKCFLASEKMNKIIGVLNELDLSKVKEIVIKDFDEVMIIIDVKDYNVNIDDQGYAFYYGRLSMEKGIYNLLKAMLNIKDRKLFVAGDGPEKDNIEKFINENNMEDRVKLLGFLDSNKIKDYVRKARVVIVPSICRENCPYSVLETLAIGRPIIGSNLGGIPELVKDGEYGYIYNNIEELTEKIKKLLDDKKLAEEMGKNAKNIIKREYSSDDYYKAIMNIYNKVIGDEKNERKINK